MRKKTLQHDDAIKDGFNEFLNLTILHLTQNVDLLKPIIIMHLISYSLIHFFVSSFFGSIIIRACENIDI